SDSLLRSFPTRRSSDLVGFHDGKSTEAYSDILNSDYSDELVFHGSATPMIYGSFLNTFHYQRFNLSFNLTYKFDYWFRRSNVFRSEEHTSELQSRENLV